MSGVIAVAVLLSLCWFAPKDVFLLASFYLNEGEI
jgi:hypothetical protein